MSNIREIKIGFSCSQNFDGMQFNKRGKHCNECNKTVIDFTKYSNAQIIQFFEKDKRKTCGRFYEKQLKSIALEQQKRLKPKSSFLKIAVIIFFLFLYSCKTIEPINESCEVHNSKYEVVNNLMLDENLTILKGKMQDYNKEPLIGATINIYGNEIGIITDIDGTFNLEIKDDSATFTKFDKLNKIQIASEINDSSVVEFSYVGYDNLLLNYIDIKNKEVEITLAEGLLLGDVVVIRQPAYNRLWNSIQNLFK